MKTEFPPENYSPDQPQRGGGIQTHSADLLQTSEINSLINEKYHILSNFPPNAIYGQHYVSDFTEELVEHIHQEGKGTLQIMGESVSGKSFAASAWASLLEEVGITPIYVPWVDVIRDAKTAGLVDPGRAFGELTPEEFRRTTRLYYGITDTLLSAAAKSGMETCVIGETVGIPVIDFSEPFCGQVLDRGSSAITDLVHNHDAFVAALYASSGVRSTGKDFRDELGQVRTPEEVIELVRKYDVEVHETDPEAVMNTLKASGAPVGVVSKIEDQVSATMVYLANIGAINIPQERRNLEFMQKKKTVRAQYVGKKLFPFLLEGLNSDMDVPSERTFIGFNRKIRDKKLDRFDVNEVHYHNLLDVGMVDLSKYLSQKDPKSSF